MPLGRGAAGRQKLSEPPRSIEIAETTDRRCRLGRRVRTFPLSEESTCG